MITLEKGNIFKTNKKVVVNTVNCVGVMGAGIALECRLRYPDMYQRYKQLCSKNLLAPGLLWIYKINSDRWILNFPTKIDWKFPSKEIYIKEGLEKFVNTYKEREIDSIAFPILGTYNGKLDKNVVLDIMYDYLGKCNIPISIFEYDPIASDGVIDNFRENWRSMSELDKINIFGVNQFKKIDRLINNVELNSIISIRNYDKSVTLESLEKCYKL